MSSSNLASRPESNPSPRRASRSSIALWPPTPAIPGLLLAGALALAAGCEDAVGPTGGVSSVAFTPAAPTQLVVGQEVVLNPVPLGRDGRELDLACITEFSSANPAVATVTPSGVLIAVAPGTTEVTVRLNTVPTSFTLAVVAAPGGGGDGLQLSAGDVDFDAVQGGDDPDPAAVEISGIGGVVHGLDFHITYTSQAEGWLQGALDATATPAAVMLTPSIDGLGVGTHTALVSVTGHGVDPEIVNVTLTLGEGPGGPGGPSLALSLTDVEFQADVGGADPDPVEAQVTSSGEGIDDLAIAIGHDDGEPTGWLAAVLMGATTPAIVELSATVGDLADGTYHATLTVSGDGAEPATARITFVVGDGGNGGGGDPSISLAADSVAFDAEEGGADPAPVVVLATSTGGPVGGVAVAVTYPDGESTGWLTVAADGTQTPVELEFAASIAGLAPGLHRALVTVSGEGVDPVVVPVTLELTSGGGPGGGPGIVVDDEEVVFTGIEGGAPPVPDTLAVTSDGDPIDGLTVRIEYAAGETQGWLTAQLLSSSTPTSLVLTPSAAGLAPGTYHATVFIEAPGSEAVTVPVRFVVQAAVLIGLEIEIGGTLFGGLTVEGPQGPAGLAAGLLELNLLDLLSDPLLDVIVWGLYSNGAKQDVTHGTTLTTGDPLLTVDGPGLLNVAAVLVAALTDPEHYVQADYEGFQVVVTLVLTVPSLADLPLVDAFLPSGPTLQLGVGSALPTLTAVLTDGVGGTVDLLVPGHHEGVEWRVAPRLTGIGLIDAVLAPLGNLVGGVLQVTDGVVSGLNLGPLGSILGLLGGALSVDVSATLADIVTDPIVGSIPLT